VVVLLISIFAPPIQDSRDLAALKSGAFGRGKGAGQAGQGLAVGIFDLQAVAVAGQVDGIAGARGGGNPPIFNGVRS